MSLKENTKALIARDRQAIATTPVIVPQIVTSLPPLVRSKLDSFVSLMTSVGTAKDRRTSYQYQGESRLSWQALKDMIKGSSITRIIVNSLVDDALKKEAKFDHKKKDDLAKKLEEIKFKSFFSRACKEARTHGMAAAFYFINDGLPAYLPVDHKRIRSVKPAFVLSKWNLNPMAADARGNPIVWQQGYEIEFYEISSNGRSEIWHISRMLLAYGEYAGEDNLNENNGNPESIIDLNRKPILLIELVTDNVTTLSDQIIREVIQLEGLENKLNSDSEEVLLQQVMAMMMGLSTVNKLLLDGQDKFSYHNADVSGYDIFYNIAKNNVAASSKTPKTKLFGDSPAGSIGSNTGSYEDDVWDNNVDSFRSEIIRPELNKAINWIKPLINIPEQEIIIYSFPSLKPMSPKEDAEIKLLHANRFSILVSSGILRKEAVTLSQYRGEYTDNIQLPDHEIARLEKALLEDPQPEPSTDKNNPEMKGNNDEERPAKKGTEKE